jgi:hypothetical protein
MADAMEEGAGKAMEMVPRREARLLLLYEPHSCALKIEGEIASFDEALNMLAQAARHFEDQRRIQNAQQFVANAAQATLTEKIRADLQRRN